MIASTVPMVHGVTSTKRRGNSSHGALDLGLARIGVVVPDVTTLRTACPHPAEADMQPLESTAL